jgi:hypothetical protein
VAGLVAGNRKTVLIMALFLFEKLLKDIEFRDNFKIEKNRNC